MENYSVWIEKEMLDKDEKLCPISYEEHQLSSLSNIRSFICIPNDNIPKFYNIESAYEYFIMNNGKHPYTRTLIDYKIKERIILFYEAYNIVKERNIDITVEYIRTLFNKWLQNIIEKNELIILRAYLQIEDLDIFYDFKHIDSMQKRNSGIDILKNSNLNWIVRTGSIKDTNTRQIRVLMGYKLDNSIFNILIIKLKYGLYYTTNDKIYSGINADNIILSDCFISYLDVIEKLLKNKKSN